MRLNWAENLRANIDKVDVEKRLWSAADQLRANTELKPSQLSNPVLGLIFLRYAKNRFAKVED